MSTRAPKTTTATAEPSRTVVPLAEAASRAGAGGAVEFAAGLRGTGALSVHAGRIMADLAHIAGDTLVPLEIPQVRLVEYGTL
jgi:hypothetical protein